MSFLEQPVYNTIPLIDKELNSSGSNLAVRKVDKELMMQLYDSLHALIKFALLSEEIVWAFLI